MKQIITGYCAIKARLMPRKAFARTLLSGEEDERRLPLKSCQQICWRKTMSVRGCWGALKWNYKSLSFMTNLQQSYYEAGFIATLNFFFSSLTFLVSFLFLTILQETFSALLPLFEMIAGV